MIWGCMTAHGPKLLQAIPSHLNQRQYTHILSECSLGVVGKYGMDKEDTIFQYDNNPKYRAKSVKQRLWASAKRTFLKKIRFTSPLYDHR
jgi:hypothetical protein